MAITRWDPFREVVALQNRVNSLFRDFNESDSPLTTASFVPAVDVYEDAEKVVLKLEVPGIEEKDLDIRVENHTLTVKGERKAEAKQAEFLHQGIAARGFERRFQLADHVQVTGAVLENGLLHVDLVREIPEAKKPRQIQIASGSRPQSIEGSVQQAA